MGRTERCANHLLVAAEALSVAGSRLDNGTRRSSGCGVTLTTDHLSGSGIWRSSVTHEVVRVDHHLIEDLVDPTRAPTWLV